LSDVWVADLAIGFPEFPRRFDVGQEGASNQLDRLAIEGKLAFGGTVQVVLVRPARVLLAGFQVHITAHIPDACGFHAGFA